MSDGDQSRISGRRLDVQGLRAVAVLAVMAYHAKLPVPGGYAGVDVFFVISGFVITGVLLRDRTAHGRIRLARFYGRRVARLFPALALVVAVALVGSVLLLSPFGPQRLAAATARGALLIHANEAIRRNLGGYFDVTAESDPLLHTWSLSVEEQFYLVLPALLALVWWRTRRPSALRAVLLVGALTAASATVVLAGPALAGALPGSLPARVI